MSRLLFSLCILACLPSLLFGADTDAAWLTGIPLDKAIRIGTGTQVVIEVSDPDCRFSRRMVRYWNLRRDVTRYVFLIALKEHPDAAGKVRYILCAPDREAAYREAYAGKLDFDEKTADRSCDVQELQNLHRDVAARLGAVGTPTYVINGVKVDGAKVAEIERLLGEKKMPFDAGAPK
ncbi:MAG: protein-disulfide isomerase [Geobacter sp.]|nr:MAG: protein-disulfide isomerase [Geobacter sp.]